MDGTLYSLDAKNGWPIWKFRLSKGLSHLRRLQMILHLLGQRMDLSIV
ncbi:hypothetical protein [Candidatus Villigracilis proximus]